MTAPIRITRRALDILIAHARQASPAECCGMLIGRGNEVLDAFRARNIAESVSRFLIDPKDHIDARRLARGSGLEVVGFYHSHPRSNPEPSATDLAEASYADAVYLVVSLETDPPPVQAYRLVGDRFERTAIEPVAD